jgi:hypothetical protein
MITAFAIFVILASFEIWLPVAGLFFLLKLVTSFSLSAAWEAFVSVPMWIWYLFH